MASCPIDGHYCDCIYPCMTPEAREKLIQEDAARYRKAVDDVNRMNDKGEIPRDEQGSR